MSAVSSLLVTISTLFMYEAPTPPPFMAGPDTNEVASATAELDPTRTIEIIGPIRRGFEAKVAKFTSLLEGEPKPIHLLINSPGGSVFYGEMMVSAMGMAKARGIEIHCTVPVYAASMAFTIYSECTHRYAFPNAMLLFHPVRIMFQGPLTAYKAKDVHNQLVELDAYLVRRLLASLGMEETEFLMAFHNEYWWSAHELLSHVTDDWLTLVKDVKGVKTPFKL